MVVTHAGVTAGVEPVEDGSRGGECALGDGVDVKIVDAEEGSGHASDSMSEITHALTRARVSGGAAGEKTALAIRLPTVPVSCPTWLTGWSV